MPLNIPDNSRLTEFARGYAYCLLALGGDDSDEFFRADLGDFSDRAMEQMADDCNAYLALADEWHPRGKEGVDDLNAYLYLGWYFGFSRVGKDAPFSLIVPGPFGRVLTEMAMLFDRVSLGLDPDGKVVFR